MSGYLDASRWATPRYALPGTFAFVHSPDGGDYDEVTREALAWCEANLGRGALLAVDGVMRPIRDDEAWGYWPSGAIFIREAAHAVWFKFVWC